MRRVVAYVPDLMDRSKVAGAAEPGRLEVDFVGRPSDLPGASEGADLVVVDLNRPGVIDVIASVPAPVVAFSRHTDEAAMRAAAGAGAGRVMARSAFFARLDRILAGGGEGDEG